jgi:hypothetical protein
MAADLPALLGAVSRAFIIVSAITRSCRLDTRAWNVRALLPDTGRRLDRLGFRLAGFRERTLIARRIQVLAAALRGGIERC